MRRLIALLAAATCASCQNLSTPLDYLLNLGDPQPVAEWHTPPDGVRRVVVLRHGLWRSAASMAKLERALCAHGYETLNRDYPSTSGSIQEHAARLHGEIEGYLARPDPLARPVELYLVGHSMGGLQIRSYLGQPGARQPTACVFLATPHRGAVLTDRRKDWLLFKLSMGDRVAPLQLSPGSAFYRTLSPMHCPFGIVYGARGDGDGWNDDIPGDDDGTVGVSEAQLEGAVDVVCLPLGHTALSIDDSSVREVLCFLRYGRFASTWRREPN
ncbi:MAG: alpha/beta fold hydrolase [Planctomycetes bacterium]|nr:alpha/beta fold hydrolase [Planctomycetota bacterium]